MKDRGYGRIALGMVLLLGVAGRADQTPLSWDMLPMALLALSIGLWGVSRSKHGPTLLLLVGWIDRCAARRHRLVLGRAARR